jgi:hypothetical protein
MFCFKDDSIVNTVAKPNETCRIYVLRYCPDCAKSFIGDYKEYDYLEIHNFDVRRLSRTKSIRNKLVIENNRQTNKAQNLLNI